MSQRVPWLQGHKLCAVCGASLGRIKDPAQAGKIVALCDMCRETAYAALKMYVGGECGVESLMAYKATKGFLFSREVIGLFVDNLPTMMDEDGFRRWWSTNAIGDERHKMPSVDIFVSMVLNGYNDRARAARAAAAPRPDVEVPVEAVADLESALRHEAPTPAQPDRPQRARAKTKKQRRLEAAAAKGAKKPDAGGQAAAPVAVEEQAPAHEPVAAEGGGA